MSSYGSSRLSSSDNRLRPDRETYNYKHEHARIWSIDETMFNQLPSRLQMALQDVLKAGADASACLERVKVAEEQVEDADDCYDMFHDSSTSRAQRPEHRHLERSDEEVERFPCSPIIGTNERSGLSSNASPGFTSSSSICSDDFHSPLAPISKHHGGTSMSLFPPPISPSADIDTISYATSALISPIDINSPHLRSPFFRSSSVSMSVGGSQANSPPSQIPPVIRTRRTSTTRFAHHMDLRTQTYIGEIHNFRYTSLPRLRHAMRRLKQEWDEVIRNGKDLALHRRDSVIPSTESFRPGSPSTTIEDQNKVSKLIDVNDEVSVVFEKWVEEKSDYLTFLENRSTELGVGLDVGVCWGANGAVAWT